MSRLEKLRKLNIAGVFLIDNRWWTVVDCTAYGPFKMESEAKYKLRQVNQIKRLIEAVKDM